MKESKFDAAMLKKYNIRPNLDYSVDITAVALYLVLEEQDLKQIAVKNKNRYEAAFQKKMNEKQ